MRTFSGPVVPIALAIALVGCGAKTGLDVPDATVDAGMDAGTDASIPCLELPPDGGIIDLPLATDVVLARADIVFAVDTTGTMSDELDRIRRDLRDRIAPAIQRTIADSRLGVTSFADFPVEGCGTASAGDSPFRLHTPVTDDLARVQVGLDSIALGNGADDIEAQVEAAYQIATGEGVGTWVPASFGCPGGGFGYPCFRTDAVPIVLMFSDAPFHNGPRGVNPYSAPDACPSVADVAHTFDEATAALEAGGIRVIGLYSGPPGGAGRDHLAALADATGAIDAEGRPLVFDIGRRGERLSESVIDAIAQFADVIEFDVIDTVLVDPDPTDGIDPRELVGSVLAVSAEPSTGVREVAREAGEFRGVQTGTRVLFQLDVRGGVTMPGPPRRVLLEVVFRGDGTRLGSTVVELVIGGECDDPLLTP
ncbi:MAG: hypothetical protein M3Y87_31230 [Myxococcota bacterium]|nr:hypothetical protein [Myxococcota bacterium]